MARMGDSGDLIKCSFCSKTQKQVKQLIAGPQIYICDECVTLCNEIIDERGAENPEAKDNEEFTLSTPVETAEFLDRFVIGQERAKRALAVAVYNHYKRIQVEKSLKTFDDKKNTIELAKSNVLLLGPTGTGKTYLAQTLARQLGVPFIVADATALTEAGYVGEDVENILVKLLQAADYDVAKAELGIIYIDEIDKITRKADNPSITRDVSGEGVQQALLKILEGTVASLPPQGGRKQPNQDYISLDTSRILFIAAGAFAGLEDIIASRLGKGGIGFGANIQSNNDFENVFSHTQPEDLHKFGLIPEFIGRLPVVTSVDALDIDALVRILIEPRNALVKQYQYMFKLDGVDLEFEDEALTAIAELAIARKTGARGLRSILEKVLGNTMFMVPSDPEVVKVVVTRDCVVNETEPLVLRTKVADSKSA